MQTMKNLEEYQRYFDEYQSYLAQTKYDKALDSLDSAIHYCPVREALPVLTARRVSLEQLLHPFGYKLTTWIKPLAERLIWKRSG